MSLAIAVGTAAAAFNLSCPVTDVHHFRDGQNMTSHYTVTLRVDLGRRLYCQAECKTPISIYAITQTNIVLMKDDTATANLDRMSGRYSEEINVPGIEPVTISGLCDRRPFTGFPSRKF